MNFPKTKKALISLLAFLLLCNFLLSDAKSDFKPPVLNPTDLAFNDAINAIAVDEMTGIVYVGGNFTKIGNEPRSNFASFSIPE